MKNDILVLNNIYKIVDMGIIGIDDVLTKIKSKVIEKVFIDERKEYNLIRIEAIKLLGDYEQPAKGISKVGKISSNIMTNMELINNVTDEKIVKMMLQGTFNGVIELSAILNKKELTNPKIINLANRLMDTLEHNICDVKKYL